MSASAAPNSPIPSGLNVLMSFPEVLMIGEFVFGGLVWILVASSKIPNPDLQGWLMFVSVFCFIITTLLCTLYMLFAFVATLLYAIHAIFSILRWKSSS
ncbi:myelin and lymphocyte protein-like [Scyliorhinus torazame]|uniref:myelin and lymphocyte protein-like n=1 Tax=Scyliorhinus torazame TaxID=75743 RepID=UPI003B5AD0B9